MNGREGRDRQERDAAPVRIAICGFGEIATKAHLPAISRSCGGLFRLAAVVDPDRATVAEKLGNLLPSENCAVRLYRSLSECLADAEDAAISLDAVSVCTPSTVTLDLAHNALEAGKHVLVEKPPGDWKRLKGLRELAASRQVTLFTAYHTAVCVGLPHSQEWLRTHARDLKQVRVIWKESVRKFHPCQVWVTKKDPSTNACEGVLDIVFNPLSLLFALLGPLEFQSSSLTVPSNWETPISGSFSLTATAPESGGVIPVTGDFAWDYEPDEPDEPEEIWTVSFRTPTSTLLLTDGGSQVYVDGRRVTTQPTAAYPLEPEYENLYCQFASLIASKQSAADETTPRLLQEIQAGAIWNSCPAYDI